nr:restriction endonuclease subunit S [uncultured Desulfuromonas sp.]
MKSPFDWEKKLIEELCDFTNGYGFKSKEWAKTGLPIIRIQNLNGSRNFNYYQGEPNDSWIVEPGDLLFAWAGVPGVSFGPTLWNGPKGVLNQHIYKVEPSKGIRKDWLFLALKIVTSRIEKKAHGFKSSLLHINKTDITEQVVFVPEESEQREIAKTLGVWERTINLTEQLIAEKQERRKGLMQGLLSGKRRLPGFSGGWKVKLIGNLLAESRIPGSNGENAKKLSVQLHGRGVRLKNEIRQGSASTSYFIRKSGQFIYSKLDFLNGAFGIVPDELDGFESTLDLPAFDVSDKLNKQWLLYYVTRKEYYSQQLGLANGGRKARRVNPKAFLGSKIAFPEKAEQDEIVRVLDISGREISLLNEKLTALREQKKGLMQQLLTGKIRVKT